MKKFIASTLLGFAFLSGYNSVTSHCGWSFERAQKEGLPPTFCFLRQERGHDTMDGHLNRPCSGSSCPVTNNVNN